MNKMNIHPKKPKTIKISPNITLESQNRGWRDNTEGWAFALHTTESEVNL